MDCKARQKHKSALYIFDYTSSLPVGIVALTSSICDVEVPWFNVFTVFAPVWQII